MDDPRCFVRSLAQPQPALSTSEAWCHLRALLLLPEHEHKHPSISSPPHALAALSDMEKSPQLPQGWQGAVLQPYIPVLAARD